MPPDLPRGSHQAIMGTAVLPENRLFLVARAGISETGILKI